MAKKKNGETASSELGSLGMQAKKAKGRPKGSTKYQDGLLLDIIEADMPTDKTVWHQVSPKRYMWPFYFVNFVSGAGCLQV